MNYVLDTNILLLYLRDKAAKHNIETKYKLFSNDNNLIISAVTIGEIKSIGSRNKWEKKRIGAVESFLSQLIIVGIHFEDLINAYAELDTFSQGKHETKQLRFSARNMGKNDLWIAATAVVTNSKLITTDHDFQHLSKTFLDLVLIDR